MKNACSLLIFVFLLSAIISHAQNKLEISVKNIKELKGTIRVGLFDNEENFLKEAVQGKVVDVNAATMTVVFENLKPGDYALSVIHDENANGDLDTNAVGIPKEGFGFGNDAMGLFGPPSFKKAKITMSEGVLKTVVTLKYF